MTKKRIRQFRKKVKWFADGAAGEVCRALNEALDEVERLKHRCKKRCHCGARCYLIKGHKAKHQFKRCGALVLL